MGSNTVCVDTTGEFPKFINLLRHATPLIVGGCVRRTAKVSDTPNFRRSWRLGRTAGSRNCKADTSHLWEDLELVTLVLPIGKWDTTFFFLMFCLEICFISAKMPWALFSVTNEWGQSLDYCLGSSRLNPVKSVWNFLNCITKLLILAVCFRNYVETNWLGKEFFVVKFGLGFHWLSGFTTRIIASGKIIWGKILWRLQGNWIIRNWSKRSTRAKISVRLIPWGTAALKVPSDATSDAGVQGNHAGVYCWMSWTLLVTPAPEIDKKNSET